MSAGYLPRRRVTAQVSFNPPSSIPKPKPVLIERGVHIDDFKDLKFDDRSLSTIFSERQWTRILQAKGKAYTNIVVEFYEAIYECSPSRKLRSSSYVRGVSVDFSPKTIASFLDLPRLDKDQTSSHECSANEIYHALTDHGKDHESHRMDEIISQTDLVPFFQMLHLIVSANVTPTENMKELSIEQGKFLYDIARGVGIDLPKHIFQIIHRGVRSFGSSKPELPFGLMITGLMLNAGVQIPTDEEGHQPKEPIRWTKPISQTWPPARPLTQQAGTATAPSSTEDHQYIRPPWFDAMLSEIDARVAAPIASIKSQLKDMEDRLQELRDILDTLV